MNIIVESCTKMNSPQLTACLANSYVTGIIEMSTTYSVTCRATHSDWRKGDDEFSGQVLFKFIANQYHPFLELPEAALILWKRDPTKAV